MLMPPTNTEFFIALAVFAAVAAWIVVKLCVGAKNGSRNLIRAYNGAIDKKMHDPSQDDSYFY